MTEILVVELAVGAQAAVARITDGFNYKLVGSVSCKDLGKLFRAARNAKTGKELLEIGKKFGLKPPMR